MQTVVGIAEKATYRQVVVSQDGILERTLQIDSVRGTVLIVREGDTGKTHADLRRSNVAQRLA